MSKLALPLSLSAGFLPGLVFWAVGGAGAIAQIVPAPDGTGTQVFQDGSQFLIEGGALSEDGLNLFQSFESFGLEAGQVGDFFAQPNVQNILGRVVGGDPSVINGKIQVSGAAANLFLMNSSGIVFGQQAELNVPADFTATTATGMQFGDDQWFQSTGENAYRQLNGQPTGLYLGNSGAVVNAGSLAVGLGNQLTLVGSDVVNLGSLRAPEGHLLMVALPEEGLLRLKLPGYSLGLDLDLAASLVSRPTAWTLPVAALPDLLKLDAVQANEQLSELAAQHEPGGTALVAGEVNVTGELGGTVGILGDRVGLVGADIDASGLNGGGTVLIGGDLQGQGELPTAERTGVDSRTAIAADALSSGEGGKVVVWADETARFGGRISAQGGAVQGDGGFVEVSGKETLVYRGEVNVSGAAGEVGTLLLDPADIVIINGAGGANEAELLDGEILLGDSPGATFTISEAFLEAQNGNIVLEASNRIQINNLADDALTLQPGGSIAFNAGNLFVMDDPIDTIESTGRDLSITANTIEAGNILADGQIPVTAPGSITLNAADSLEVGSVRAIFFDSSPTSTVIEQGGNITLNSGGNLTINADETTGGVTNAQGIASFSSNGDGGTIALNAVGDININCPQGFCIESFSGGSAALDPRGNGADITVISQQGAVRIGSDNGTDSILLNAGTGLGFDAGNISVFAANDVDIFGRSTSATSTGQGGDITIQSDGAIQTGLIGTYGGGNITINSSNADISTGNLETFSPNVPGGNVEVTTAGNIQIDNIDTLSPVASGSVNLNSAAGTVTVGDILSGSGVRQGDAAETTTQTGGAVDIIGIEDVVAGDISTRGIVSGGATVILSIDRGITIGDVESASDDVGGSIDVASIDSISIGDVDTQGITGGFVNVNSAAGGITAGTIQSAGTDTGGNIDVASIDSIDVASIDTQGITGGFVDVNSATGDIVTGAIQSTGTDTGGNVDVASVGDVRVDSIAAGGTLNAGGAINVFSDGDIVADTVQSVSDGVGGDIDIASIGTVRVNTVDATGAIASGRIDVHSEEQSIVVGSVQAASGSVGGVVDIGGPSSIDVGDIDVSGTGTSGGQVLLRSTNAPISVGDIQAASSNQGGTVVLDSPENIQAGFINAQGDIAGGQVDVSTGQLFQASNTFIDNSGINASISAAGATDGQVIISHDGGNQMVPFVVGDASVNGSAGAITTGAGNSIVPTRGFIGSYTQGNIQIVTADFIDPETAEFPPTQEIAEAEERPFWLDEYFTRQFESYMGESDAAAVKSLDDIQKTLQKTEKETGITPALIYVIFEPQTLSIDVEGVESLANRGDLMRTEPDEQDAIYLVLVPPTGDPIIRRTAAEATRSNAPNTIKAFRRALLISSEEMLSGGVASDINDQAHGLYQWFLEPLKADIDAYGVENLVYIMEPGLRSAPLAALSAMHDGEGYAIRHYSMGLMPSFSLTDTRYQDIRNAQMQAMGSSDFSGETTLVAVKAEVETVSQIWPRSSAPRVNEEFTWQALKGQSSDRSGILHLATHAEFNKGEPDASFIQLFDNEKILLSQMREIGLPIELLVLSACETAFDGLGYEAELGFGGLAVQTGVKSALASLWTVDDVGTFAVMSAFYDRLKGDVNPTIKAEALRQAQLAMLDSRVHIERDYLYYSESNSPLLLPAELRELVAERSAEQMNLSHPFYWAGFTMIGSPW